MIAHMPHAADKNDVMSAIEAMRVQEDSAYHCDDYLKRTSKDGTSVNEDCRQKMSEWCYQVVDYCKFNRETVAIAMSLIDRFLASAGGKDALENRKLFQLAAMTSLYTAVKVHEPEAMEPKTIAGLSRGAYTEQQVTDMELSILQAIGWRMNPPTPIAFVQHYLSLLPEDEVSASDLQSILELAKFQTELALHDYSLVKINASTIALAAVANAMHTVNVSMEVQKEFLRGLSNLLRVKTDSEEVHDTQMKLFDAMQSSPVMMPRTQSTMIATTSKAMQTSGDSSPRSVARS